MTNDPSGMSKEQLLAVFQTTCLSGETTIDDVIALSRQLIQTESTPTMEHRARRAVFGEKISERMLRLLERIPTLRAIDGAAGTNRLAEIIAADADIQIRHAYRVIRVAEETGWLTPKPHKRRLNGTDNQYNVDRKLPDKFASLTNFRISVGKAVEAQLADPLNFNAGKEFLPQNIYIHPTAMVIEKIMSKQPRTRRGTRS